MERPAPVTASTERRPFPLFPHLEPRQTNPYAMVLAEYRLGLPLVAMAPTAVLRASLLLPRTLNRRVTVSLDLPVSSNRNTLPTQRKDTWSISSWQLSI